MNKKIVNPFISIAAPVYNEEKNIEKVIKSWFRYIKKTNLNAEVIIFNDGSNDSTKTILNKLANKYKNLRVFGHTENQGYGSAMLGAINKCSGDYIVTIDSDGQFDLSNIEKLLTKLHDNVVGVTGYRLKKDDSIIRVVADRLLNLIVRLLFNVKLKDTNCALKIIKRDILKNIKIESTGFSFPTEVCLKILFEGNSLNEIQVHHYKRSAGESKLNVFSTGWNMFLFLIYLKLKFILKKKNKIKEDTL